MSAHEDYGDYGEEKRESRGVAGVGSAITFLLIGMGVGTAVALLLAPMSGREMRDTIRQGCRQAFDGISEQTRNLRDRGSNLLGFGRRKAAGSKYERGTRI